MSKKDDYIKSVNKIKASDKMKEQALKNVGVTSGRSAHKASGWHQVKLQEKTEYNWTRRVRISCCRSYSNSSYSYATN